MRKEMHNLFFDLEKNQNNYVTYFVGQQRVQRSFYDLSIDIKKRIGQLNTLNTGNAPLRVAIIGPTSYQWMVTDLACVIGGFYSIAVPEFLAQEEVNELLQEARPDVVLVDETLRKQFQFQEFKTWFFGESNTDTDNIEQVKATEGSQFKENKILEEYSLAYSSGTSGKVKAIPLRFKEKEGNGLPKNIFKRLAFIYWYKTSFWSRKDNKVILFMPFSHLQQRTFLVLALTRKINVVLSDPTRCIIHLITEKPNIMIAVPLIYEVLAKRIKQKIDRFSPQEKRLFEFYNKRGINGWSKRNPLRKYIESKIFGSIRKVYGGRADYFVSGSAPIDPELLRIFYSVGVKVFEGYGQSESDFIAINTEKNFRIGSVGKPMLKVVISKESEVLIRFDEKRHNRELLQVDEDGFIHTGDQGHLDKDGFLFINGRIDDALVLQNGKKVFPNKLEQLIERIDGFAQAFVTSRNGDLISAVLVSEDLVGQAKNQEKLIESIRAFNTEQATHERIAEVCFSKQVFSVENGRLTANFKMRRKVLKKEFEHAQYVSLV